MSGARCNDSREYDARISTDEWPRVYDTRDRDEHDPRDALMRDLDLPRGGDDRELVVDRDRVYELDGADSRTLAPTVRSASRRNTISTFRKKPGEPSRSEARRRG